MARRSACAAGRRLRRSESGGRAPRRPRAAATVVPLRSTTARRSPASATTVGGCRDLVAELFRQVRAAEGFRGRPAAAAGRRRSGQPRHGRFQAGREREDRPVRALFAGGRDLLQRDFLQRAEDRRRGPCGGARWGSTRRTSFSSVVTTRRRSSSKSRSISATSSALCRPDRLGHQAADDSRAVAGGRACCPPAAGGGGTPRPGDSDRPPGSAACRRAAATWAEISPVSRQTPLSVNSSIRRRKYCDSCGSATG